MALTFRDIKGSPLTTAEVDNNFRHFTGSHEISGSLTLSGSLLNSYSSSSIGSETQPFPKSYITEVHSINHLISSGSLVLSNYSTLNFIDDVDAAANDVPLGGIYHTTGSLKVRIE